MIIYLIRHGKTRANEEHLYCGSTDLPLSQSGIEKLCKPEEAISGVRYLTSGMKRTNETLRLMFGNVPYESDRRFREVDFGDFEMHSYEQLKERRDYQIWLTGDNTQNVPPEGESGAQMTHRVICAFKELAEDTVLVTHGGVIAAIMAWLFPQAGKNRYQWQPEPGRGYRLEQKDGLWEYSCWP